MRRSILQLFSLAAVIITVSSCGPRYLEYGVVVWNADQNPVEGFGNAGVVGILTNSDIRDVYGIAAVDNPEAIPVEIDRWRIRTFPKLEDARAWAQDYTEYSDAFAAAGTQSLPIRAIPDNTSDMVYRLRKDERIKILYRQPEQTNLSGLVDYWYQVITETGVSGWVFGYNLNLDAAPGTSGAAVAAASDPVLLNLFAHVWRPESWLDMIRRRRFDLEEFSSRYGLFTDRAANTMRIVLPGEESVFRYSSLYSPRYLQYLAEGTSLQITVINDNRLSVQYEYDGRLVARTLVVISEDVDALAAAEIRRREALLENLVSTGTVFQSTNYGVLELGKNGSFSWRDFPRFQTGIIPDGFTGYGRIVFDLYLADELAQSFTGVLGMVPSGQDTWNRMNWLYTLTSEGIRIENLRALNIDDITVESRNISPFIVFFEHAPAENPDAASSDE